MSLFKELYVKAFNLFKAESFENALLKLNEAEKNYVSDEENITLEDIEILKGSIGLETNNLELARSAFEKALKLNPESAEACIGIGQVFYAVNSKEEAKKMFEWANVIEPENVSGKNALTNINEELGYPKNHNSLLQESDEVQSEGNDFTILFDEAYDLFMKNDFENALSKIGILQNKFEEETRLLKANIYLGMGKTEKAKEEFEEILRLNNKCTAASNALGEIYFNKGQLSEAKTMYELSISRDPDDQFALVGLAEINRELGLSPSHSLLNFFSGTEFSKELNDKIEKAFELFNKKDYKKSLKFIDGMLETVTEHDEKKAKDIISSLLNFKGFNLLALKNSDEAQKVFEESLKYNPDSSQASAGIGEILYLNNMDKEAKTMFEWAVKNNRNNMFAVAGLAKTNQTLGLPADHNMLEMGIDTEDSAEFNELLTEAYTQFGNKEYKKTLELLKKAEMLIDPDSTLPESKRSSSSIRNFMGFCNLALNETDDARICFEKALQTNPRSSQACAGLGEIFYLMHDEKRAKQMYEWAIRNEPENKFAAAGLGKVNKILGLEPDDNTLTSEKITKISEEINNLIKEGYDLYTRKEFSASVDVLEKAGKLLDETFTSEQSKETRASLNNFLGFNYLSLKMNDEAKSCFEKSLECNPNSSQACAGLAEIFFLQEEDEKAKTMYELALQNNPENQFAIAGLAKVNSVLGYPKDHKNSMK